MLKMLVILDMLLSVDSTLIIVPIFLFKNWHLQVITLFPRSNMKVHLFLFVLFISMRIPLSCIKENPL